MDLLSFILGLVVSIWGVLQTIYPQESKWFHKKWINYLETKIRPIALIYIIIGCIFLLIVWYTNRFLILLVIGSFMLYTGLKYLLFGRKIIELSRISLKSPENRWRLMGGWMLLGGLGLIYLSTWV